jgi:small subunit ribosomal protein S4
MGKPKFSRKKYETPSHPWQEDRIKEENELIKKYGLKNKREVWKAQTVLRKYRGQARELLAKVGGGDPQIRQESDQLLMHLTRMNILPPNSTLDDVLALKTESILSRRLQTLAYLKGLANTPDQARQLISHGHIAIGITKITVPGYMVTKDEEGEIGYVSDSPLTDTLHPARPRADFQSIPLKKSVEPEEPMEKKPETKPDEKQKEEEPSEEKPKDVVKEEIKEVTSDESAVEKKEEITPQKEEQVKEAAEEKPTKPEKKEIEKEKEKVQETSDSEDVKVQKNQKKGKEIRSKSKNEKGGK